LNDKQRHGIYIYPETASLVLRAGLAMPYSVFCVARHLAGNQEWVSISKLKDFYDKHVYEYKDKRSFYRYLKNETFFTNINRDRLYLRGIAKRNNGKDSLTARLIEKIIADDNEAEFSTLRNNKKVFMPFVYGSKLTQSALLLNVIQTAFKNMPVTKTSKLTKLTGVTRKQLCKWDRELERLGLLTVTKNYAQFKPDSEYLPDWAIAHSKDILTARMGNSYKTSLPFGSRGQAKKMRSVLNTVLDRVDLSPTRKSNRVYFKSVRQLQAHLRYLGTKEEVTPDHLRIVYLGNQEYLNTQSCNVWSDTLDGLPTSELPPLTKTADQTRKAELNVKFKAIYGYVYRSGKKVTHYKPFTWVCERRQTPGAVKAPPVADKRPQTTPDDRLTIAGIYSKLDDLLARRVLSRTQHDSYQQWLEPDRVYDLDRVNILSAYLATNSTLPGCPDDIMSYQQSDLLDTPVTIRPVTLKKQMTYHEFIDYRAKGKVSYGD
jgi:hypothetical protein